MQHLPCRKHLPRLTVGTTFRKHFPGKGDISLALGPTPAPPLGITVYHRGIQGADLLGP